MLGTMSYKGLMGSVERSEADDCYFGQILGTDDMYVYEGGTLEDLRVDFEAFAEAYLESCARRHKEPPYAAAFGHDKRFAATA